MIPSREHLLNSHARLEQLRQVRKKVDPASGISLMIRRGPVEQCEEGEARNQWIPIELGGDLEGFLDDLIARQEAVFNSWIHSVKRDIEDAQKALDAVTKIPLEAGKKKG